MFGQVSAVVVSGLFDLSKGSGDIIIRNINKLGGFAVHYKQAHDQKWTHVIVPTDITEERLIKCLNVEELPSCFVITSAWAIDSVKMKRRMSEDDYTWSEPKVRKTSIDESASPELKRRVVSPPHSPTRSYSSGLVHSPITSQKSPIAPKYSQVSTETQNLWESKKHLFSFATQSHDSTLNNHIADVLEILSENYKILDDKGRHFAYREAVARLHSLPFKVTSIEQLVGEYKWGEKMLKKIKEILETGTCKRVELMKTHELLNTIKLFTQIWGVGQATAKRLYRSGYRTIEQIRRSIPNYFNSSQKIGLELFEEINERMPREEAKQIIDIVERVSKAVVGDRHLTIIPCGSYRRGRELVGDVDILMTFEDGGDYQGVLTRIVEALEQEGLLTHRLSVSGKFENKRPTHDLYAGVCRLPNSRHRRIDIKFYPRQNFAWALLHFTGSANFNRSLRLFAKKKGFRLSDEGYFSAVRCQGETLQVGLSAVCYTEEDIFALFGIDYKTPEERDI